MKRYKFTIGATVLALVLAAGFAINNRAEANDVLKLGAKAPMADVKMKSVDGKDYTIAGVKGENGTLVMFSCNHCPWVIAWEDRIAEIGNAYQKKGFGVIVINPNDPGVKGEDSYEEMVQRAKEKGFEFPYVVDATSDVARAFGATRTPEVFLFDTAGKLVYHGAIDDNARNPEAIEKHYLKDALNAMVAGKAIPTAQTKALGCTIKWRKADS